MGKINKTEQTIYLSRSERRIGGRFFLRFTALNGLGITFIGDATVTLLAINFGAGNLELGLISAMMYISGIVLLIVPSIFRNRNVVTVAFWAWIFRGLASLPYVALFFLEGKAAVALILGLYALFCISRTAGVSMVNTIQKRLMIRSTQGEVIFRNASSFQGSQIISRLISYFILTLKSLSELSGLIILQFIGIIINSAASFTLRKVPNRTRIEYTKGENLFVIFIRNMKNPQHRRILFIRWISLGQLILFTLIVPFLRRFAGISSASIFIYTIAVSLAALISSSTLRPLVNRAGSRPIFFYSTIPTGLLFLYWTFIPDKLNLAVYSVTGFATMMFLYASVLAVNRMLIGITPDQEAVTFNSMETFFTSVLAILLGFTAGFLADLSQSLSSLLPINDYGFVFLLAALGALVQIILVLKVTEPGSISLKEAAGIITNIGNFRLWQTLSHLEATADPVKRQTLIRNMGHSHAPLASTEIRKILNEPLSSEKGELIGALFQTKRPDLLDFLCKEAEEPSSFHRERAIFALGAYPDKKTSRVLENLLQDSDSRIRASAAKSLGRINSQSRLDLIGDYWKQCRNLNEILDYMIALFHMDPERRYIDDLFSTRFSSSGERMQRTLFTLLAQQFGMVPPLGIIYRDEMTAYGMGLETLLEESRDTRFMLDNEEEVKKLWFEHRYQQIWGLCHDAMAGIHPPKDLLPLLRSILSFPETEADAANGLAGLYFSYQILTAGTT